MVVVYGNSISPFPLLHSLRQCCSPLHLETGNLGNEALIVTRDKMVYALGNNIAGCLGTGDAHSTLYPKKVEALCEKDIKTFAYGSGPHVLVLTKEGEVC